MKTTDFAKNLTDFMGQYLPNECGASPNTIATYSATFTLLLEHMFRVHKIKAERVTLADLTKDTIIGFLDWTQKDRKCSSSTRNLRLAALHSFFRFLQYRDIKGIGNWQDMLTIKPKKCDKPEMVWLTSEEVAFLLRQPDTSTRTGMRDLALLGLLYDSAMRVQEIIDTSPCDFRFGETVTVSICGKGSKVRTVPLTGRQVANLTTYMEKVGLKDRSRHQQPLFPNRQGGRMSRMAVLNIVKKYVTMARDKKPEWYKGEIGCHTFRHSKAMHMLEAGINLVYIRDFLGHSSVETTEIYARASEKLKRDALAKLNPDVIVEGEMSWQKDKDLLEYLKSLQNKY